MASSLSLAGGFRTLFWFINLENTLQLLNIQFSDSQQRYNRFNFLLKFLQTFLLFEFSLQKLM